MRASLLFVLLLATGAHAGSGAWDGNYLVSLRSPGNDDPDSGGGGTLKIDAQSWTLDLTISVCIEPSDSGGACELSAWACGLTGGDVAIGSCSEHAAVGWRTFCDDEGCSFEPLACIGGTTLDCSEPATMELRIVSAGFTPEGLRHLVLAGDVDWFPDGERRDITGEAGGL